MSVVETKGLTFSRKGVSILQGINLKVEAGSVTGFLGPNGAGKTTTILLLLGLLGSDDGSITLFGEPFHPAARKAKELKGRIGYLAQKPSFYPGMSCREVMQFTARLHYRRITRKLNEWLGDCMEMAGIYGLAERKCGALSGGEIQRLGLAQAWVTKPDLLILDEPAASLDPAGRYAVLSMMRELQKESTIFFSTHILEDVERVSDRLIIMNKGEVIMNGPTEQIQEAGASVELELEFSGGSPEELKERLLGSSWLRSVTVQNGLDHFGGNKGKRNRWTVEVEGRNRDGVTNLDSRAEGGEKILLRTLLEEPGIRIHRFGEKQKRLEEIFLGLTQKNAREEADGDA